MYRANKSHLTGLYGQKAYNKVPTLPLTPLCLAWGQN